MIKLLGWDKWTMTITDRYMNRFYDKEGERKELDFSKEMS